MRVRTFQRSRSDMDLSIVIVNWNTRDLLAKCLDSAFANSPECEFDVWVVDNASGDGSAEMVRERFPQVRLIENRENVGFARANNQAIEQSQGDSVLLLNSDAVLTPGALDLLLCALLRDSLIAAAGPQLIFPDGHFQAGPADFPTFGAELLAALSLGRFLRGGRYPACHPSRPSGEVDWIGGACLLIRRKALAEVGLLNPAFFFYAEETDWCYRAQKHGWKIYYASGARVFHHGGASVGPANPEMKAQLYRSKLLYFQLHHSPWQTRVLRQVFRTKGFIRHIWFTVATRLIRESPPGWKQLARQGEVVFRNL